MTRPLEWMFEKVPVTRLFLIIAWFSLVMGAVRAVLRLVGAAP